MLDEPVGDYEVGREFDLPAAAVRLHSRALVTVDGEVAVLAYLPDGSDIEEYTKARRALLNEDSRVVTVEGRALTLRESVEAMRDDSRGSIDLPACPLGGPMVGGKWLDEVMKQGHISLVSRHERWAAESGVQRGSGLAFEHEALSRALQLLATHDGFNLRVSAGAELMLRRLQLLEDAVGEDPSNPSYDGASHFMGQPSRRGGGFVHPELKKYVAEELGREAAIMKEKRKAREARGPKGRGKGKEEPAK